MLSTAVRELIRYVYIISVKFDLAQNNNEENETRVSNNIYK